jgi:RimJ/RimL family protein N-acetyltransferase
MAMAAAQNVVLRETRAGDLPAFCEYEADPAAAYMAAFTRKDPADREAALAHWTKVISNGAIIKRTIEVDGQVAGSVLCFELFGEPSVSYWIGRQFWGRGIATAALHHFLACVDRRPLFARAAKDNAGSVRVLQKCGFVVVGQEMGFANARGEEIEEVVLKLS